jgi:hypothetical protein
MSDRGWAEVVAAFGDVGAASEAHLIDAIRTAHDLLGFHPDRLNELMLALSNRPETFALFDTALRLGAGTEELQRILLQGLFSETPVE